jgi:hypothetical protein
MSENLDPQLSRGMAPTQSPQQKSFPFSTEVISLPSKGLCYPETHPLAKGQITIKLMTAKEEDILTSSNLIRKGIHIDKLLESIVVEPGVKPEELLLGDKNAILVASRMLAFGADYPIVITDKYTGQEVEVNVDLSKIEIKEIEDSLLNRNNEYDYTLPQTNTPIKFKLLTHGDELAIDKDIEAISKVSQSSSEITARYRRLIIEVNGNRDISTIADFVNNKLLAKDSRDLRKYITSITPDLNFTFNHTYPTTGETEALGIPFGIDFFYPAE